MFCRSIKNYQKENEGEGKPGKGISEDTKSKKNKSDECKSEQRKSKNVKSAERKPEKGKLEEVKSMFFKNYCF